MLSTSSSLEIKGCLQDDEEVGLVASCLTLGELEFEEDCFLESDPLFDEEENG